MESDTNDTISISLKFVDGSIGVINYFSNGSNSVSKERVEVFVGNKILQLDNYRKLVGYGWSGFKKLNLWNQDKGQFNCVSEFVDAISHNKGSPITFDQILEVSRVAIEINESIR
jgi:predicted dehydrogenase